MNDEERIQFMVDPLSGRIAMLVPAPFVVFETLEEFDGFINMMQEELVAFRAKSDECKTETGVIDKDYASKVIENWQAELKNLPMDDGPQR